MTTATPDKKTVIRDLTEQAKAKGQLSNKEIFRRHWGAGF